MLLYNMSLQICIYILFFLILCVSVYVQRKPYCVYMIIWSFVITYLNISWNVNRDWKDTYKLNRILLQSVYSYVLARNTEMH